MYRGFNMIKNILIYLALLSGVFIFNVFYYGWFSWFLLLIVVGIPVLSLLFSLPFMINGAIKGISVFSIDKIKNGDDFHLGICSKKGKVCFLPQIKIKFKIKNQFSNINKKISIKYGGKLINPYFNKLNAFSKHCGIIEAKAKYCKIYDMLGLFFIPIKIDCNLSCCVMPLNREPEKLNEDDIFIISGYKPKSGGGYSENYDLRAYQSGDRLKNIHWKLSSKLDDVIVREPTEPTYKQLIIKAELSNNPDENDDILARMNYVCKYIINTHHCCYCSSDNTSTSLINNAYELDEYFSSLFSGNIYKQCSIDKDSVIYSIKPNSEEVRSI